MPSNYTENYQLSQWEATNQVKREDFNADNTKIDAALVAASFGYCHVEYGSYVGTGGYTDLENGGTELHLGYQPKLLIMLMSELVRSVVTIVAFRAFRAS